MAVCITLFLMESRVVTEKKNQEKNRSFVS